MPQFAVRILGALEILVDGEPVAVPRGNTTTVLAVLLEEANRVVPLSSLVEAVYGFDLPALPDRQVQNTVGALRKHLGAARERVATINGAYRVDLATSELDLLRCRAKEAEARHLKDQGRSAEAAASLRAALGEWRGPTLADQSGTAVEAIRRRLDKYRLTLLERRIELDLELGRHTDVVDELRQIVTVHTLRQGFTGLLMQALHGSGQTAEAIRAFDELGDRLVDRYGIDPDPGLRALRTAILQDDAPQHEWAAALPARAREGLRVPRMLPRTIARFTGRDSELRTLDTQLQQAEGTAGLTVVTGTGGVGKTTLAIHWAHRIAHRFPDGQLYFNLHGFDPIAPEAETSSLVAEALTAFGVDPRRIPAGLNERIGLYRTVVAHRSILVVLDNARATPQVQALLPTAPGSFTLITSRDRLSALRKDEDADAVVTGLMPEADAHALLLRRIGRDLEPTEAAAITRIIGLCGRLPIALTLIGGWAANNPAFSLVFLADRLKSATGFIREMGRLDPAADPRSVFACSYQQLSSRAASAFRLFGLHPGPDLTAAAMASLMGQSVAEAETALAELVSGNLVDQEVQGRYTMHDLLRAFAKSCFNDDLTEPSQRATALRLVDHYLFTATRADKARARYRHHADLGEPAAGVAPEPIPDPAAAAAWFEDEFQVMRNLMLRFDTGGEGDVRIWQLGWILAEYLLDRYRWQDLREIQHAALAAAERADDALGRVVSLGYLSSALSYLGEDQTAADLIASIDMAELQGRSRAKAFVYYARAVLAARDGAHEDAVASAKIARACFREDGDPYWEYRAVHLVGWHGAKAGDFATARAHVGELMAVATAQHVPLGVASALLGFGFIAHHEGRYAEALAEYEKARATFAENGGDERLAYLDELAGDTHFAARDTASALAAWRAAVQGYTMFGMIAEAERLHARLNEPGGPQT